MSATALVTKKPLRNGCASSKSSESLCSTSSNNSRTRILHRRTHSGFVSLALPSSSDVRQRVLSARQHRFRTLQNKLNEVQQENASLLNENRLLKTLHKRQDNALAKYEQSSADLPQLLHAHAQELHVWQTKSRTLTVQHRELNKRIIHKDKTINELSDRIKHLKLLSESKNLEERDMLTSKVRSLERQLDEKDEEIKMLTRRNLLEAKNFKAQLANANRKYKELCQKTESLGTTKRYAEAHVSHQSSAKNAAEVMAEATKEWPQRISQAKQNHTFIVNVSGTVPAATVGTRSDECSGDEHCQQSAESEASHGSSQNGDNRTDVYDDEDDDDLIIKTMIDQERRDSHSDSRQLDEFFKSLSLERKESLPNIQDIRHEINDDIEANEVLLDLHCGEISKSLGSMSHLDDSLSAGIDDVIVTGSKTNLPRPIPPSATKRTVKRSPIDPLKKSSLLAALKSIDSMK